MLFKHISLYLLARGFPGAINFLSIAAFTRLLSPENYGLYALILSGVGFFNVVFFQWIRLSLLRFLSSHTRDVEPLLSSILAAFLGMAALTGLAGCSVFFFTPHTTSAPLFFLGTFLLWAQAWYELILEYNRAVLKPLRYGLLSGLRAILAFALGLSFVFFGLGAYGPVLGLLFGGGIAGAWGGIEMFRNIRPRLGTFMPELLSYGLPLTATFALGFVVSASDRFLLAGYLGTASVGPYSAAYDLAQQSLTLLFTVVNLAAYPLVLQAFETKGQGAAQTQLKQSGLILWGVGLPATLFLAVFSPNVAYLMLGDSFRHTAGTVLPIVALATLAAGVKAYYFDLSFQLCRNTLAQMWVLLVSAISNFFLNLWWIPQFGSSGAAWATLVAYLLGLFVSAFWGRRFFPTPIPIREGIPLTLAAFLMIFMVLPLARFVGIKWIFIQLLSCFSVYAFFLLIFFKTLRSRTIVLFKHLLP